jgi:hypothetical protein
MRSTLTRCTMMVVHNYEKEKDRKERRRGKEKN